MHNFNWTVDWAHEQACYKWISWENKAFDIPYKINKKRQIIDIEAKPSIERIKQEETVRTARRSKKSTNTNDTLNTKKMILSWQYKSSNFFSSFIFYSRYS